MQVLETRGFRIIGGSLLILLVVMLILVSGATTADEQAFLPPDQVATAMETAVADTPGNVGRINIENEEGQTLVEVYVQTDDGEVVEVEVDAEANEVVNHEQGQELYDGGKK